MVWLKRILVGLAIVIGVIVVLGGAGFLYVLHQRNAYVASFEHGGGTLIRQDGLVGRFYARKDARHRAAVLMLGGSNGSFPYDTAAQNLADTGYPTFALAYFQDRSGAPAGVPRYLANINLEYFFRALDWMKQRPEIDADKIVLMGESRGGELVLLVASLRPDVAGVIAYSPSNVIWDGLDPTYRQPAWRLGGKPLPFMMPAPFRFDAPMRRMFVEALASASPQQIARTEIAVERIHGPVLLISSKADKLWPSAPMSDAVVARLRAHHFPYPVENLQFADSSHLLMGFGPGLVRFGIPHVWEMDFGGTPEGTRKARDAGWAAAKAFLQRIDEGGPHS